MPQVVINTVPGEFKLPWKLNRPLHGEMFKDIEDLNKLFLGNYIARNNTFLIDLVRNFGEVFDIETCVLRIIEIPEGIGWTIEKDKDGIEIVIEEHRIWRFGDTVPDM